MVFRHTANKMCSVGVSSSPPQKRSREALFFVTERVGLNME